MNKSFTLLELLIVVVVIAILATLAVPQYIKSVERSKAGKARHNLYLIYMAEHWYRSQYDVYTACGDTPSTTGLNDYAELQGIDLDDEWNYSVDNASSTSFIAHAVRADGPNSGEEITVNQEGSWNTSSWSP
jgi:prepilin-type N-terminal cleavage/methylation domain-containing protein